MSSIRYLRMGRSYLGFFGMLGFVVAIAGCQLWEHTTSWQASEKNPLPPIPTSADAMELEVIFIERPIGDPLMGTALWQDVDQIGSMDSDLRVLLRRNGMRVGYVSSTPPRALQRLLNLQSSEMKQAYLNEDNKLFGRKIVLRSGAETEVQTSEMQQDTLLKLETPKGEAHKEYDQARGVLRIRAERKEGWANIEIIPEIHHGMHTLRYASSPNGLSTPAGWMFRSGQKMEPLYDYKFMTTINVGEMVIIAAQGDAPDTLGRFMFATSGDTGEKQRLIVIRLAGMTKTQRYHNTASIDRIASFRD